VKQLTVNVKSLVSSSWGSFLCPAFSAVDRPIRIRLERNFAFLAAFRTDCLMHLFLGH
jgi:hypothetical protein